MRHLQRYIFHRKTLLDTIHKRKFHSSSVIFCNANNAKSSKLKNVACQYIDSNRKSLIELSRQIWENPELAYEEVQSSKTLVRFLRKHNFEVCYLQTHSITIHVDLYILCRLCSILARYHFAVHSYKL